MKFRTTLTPKNQSEYIKSWTSVYQTGLMQFRKKREATDVGFLRPATFYLFALILGYFIVSWGMQMFTTSFVSVEVLFGILVLFFIAFHIAYGIRPKWFRFLAKRGIFYKGELEVECDNEGIRFGVSEAGERAFGNGRS